jgi:hypothetical protein
VTLSLFHSRPLAQLALSRTAADVEPSQLNTIFVPQRGEPRDYYERIRVPALPDAARTEIKRGRNPLQTFRQALRRLEVATAVELVKARAAFALSQSARKWLPSL